MHNKLILVLIGSVLLFWGGTVGAEEKPVSSQNKETQTAKYPPYPDVWDWQDTSIQKASILVMPGSLYAMPDGDILIAYDRRYAKGKKLEAHAATFFERKQFVGKGAERIVEDAEKNADKKKKEKGTASQFDYMQYKAVSQDGIWQIKSVYSYDLHCYAGANRFPYKLINTKTGEGKIFTVFRLLDEAKKFNIPEICGQPEKVIKYKVESVSGNFCILEDNSFLFQVEETGEVMRFDSSLKSKSNIVGDRYFLIENDGTDDAGVDKLTGQRYDDAVSEQIITNDLYNYLKNMRKRRK
jgi:hypothetical protein